MTQTFLIVSAVVNMLPVPVQGTGVYSGDAERNALTIARTLKQIPQPIVVSDKNRQGLLAIRKWAAEEAVRRVRARGPVAGPSYIERDRFPLYDER